MNVERIKKLYTAQHKLHNNGEYKRVLGNRPLIKTRFFSIFATPNEQACGRLGIAVGKKICPLAVWRGRIKRQIRESFRLHQNLLLGLDVVILVRPPFIGEGLVRGRQFLDKSWVDCWSYVKKHHVKCH